MASVLRSWVPRESWAVLPSRGQMGPIPLLQARPLGLGKAYRHDSKQKNSLSSSGYMARELAGFPGRAPLAGLPCPPLSCSCCLSASDFSAS